MKQRWRHQLLCGVLAAVTAAAAPASVLADEANTAETQTVRAEGETTAETEETTPRTEEAVNEIEETASGAEGTGEAAETEETAESVPTLAEQIDEYFDGSVFVGDSVMVGYSNYAMRRGGPCLGRMQFLAAVSFSVFNALRPVTATTTHPLFMGQRRLVWESLGLLQAKKVFLFFGLNDIDMGPLESTCARYAQVIANIKMTCPDAEIHIISMTYMRPGREKGRLNNPTIRQFNAMLAQMALENGWGYVDIANPLSDAAGNLAAVYCSDNYVHQNSAAYDVWTAVLMEYAKEQLEGTSAFQVTEVQKPEEEETAESEDGAESEENAETELENAEGTKDSPRVIRREHSGGQEQTGPGTETEAATEESEAGSEQSEE